jgi:two-component system NtrC family sensor kinase
LLFRDITEQKRADEALRQSEEKMRLMFESITDGIIVTDLEGRITQVNESVVRIFNYSSRDELIGRTNLDLIALKDHNQARQGMSITRKTGFGGVHEFTFVKKDGKEFPGQSSTAILIDHTGEAAGFITVAKDMTDLRQMEDQLRMRERLATIGQMVGGVAHELNNPLNVVILLSEMLMTQEIPENITNDVKMIYEEAQRAAAIVQDLLTFARKRPPQMEPLQVVAVLEDVLRLRAYEQKVENIKVLKCFDKNLPEITGDRYQLQQVFLNVILNAEDAITSVNKQGIIKIVTEPDGDLVRISITDDGPGISSENLPHVFDPFFTTKETGKGTGLGLSICYGIVKSHGGTITIDSELGEGTTVNIEFPGTASFPAFDTQQAV